MTTKTRIFPAGPGFSSLVQAQAWCRENGFVFGPSHASTKIGVHAAGRAAVFVPRWDHMSPSQQSSLSGMMVSQHGTDYHGDGVRLTLRVDLIPDTEDSGDWA